VYHSPSSDPFIHKRARVGDCFFLPCSLLSGRQAFCLVYLPSPGTRLPRDQKFQFFLLILEDFSRKFAKPPRPHFLNSAFCVSSPTPPRFPASHPLPPCFVPKPICSFLSSPSFWSNFLPLNVQLVCLPTQLSPFFVTSPHSSPLGENLIFRFFSLPEPRNLLLLASTEQSPPFITCSFLQKLADRPYPHVSPRYIVFLLFFFSRSFRQFFIPYYWARPLPRCVRSFRSLFSELACPPLKC